MLRHPVLPALTITQNATCLLKAAPQRTEPPSTLDTKHRPGPHCYGIRKEGTSRGEIVTWAEDGFRRDKGIRKGGGGSCRLCDHRDSV